LRVDTYILIHALVVGVGFSDPLSVGFSDQRISGGKTPPLRYYCWWYWWSYRYNWKIDWKLDGWKL